MCVCVSNLLHVAKNVLPAVKHSSALLTVQLVDEVSGEVLVAILISETQTAPKVIIWVSFLFESFKCGSVNPETSLGHCYFSVRCSSPEY